MQIIAKYKYANNSQNFLNFLNKFISCQYPTGNTELLYSADISDQIP